jgi:hypothetical protein
MTSGIPELWRSTDQRRSWNVLELDRLSQERAGVDAARDEERTFLLHYLREYADAEGFLPLEFDELVRESFADLVPEDGAAPAPTPVAVEQPEPEPDPEPEPAAVEEPAPAPEPEPQPVATAAVATPPKRLDLTKKLLMLGILIGLIAFVVGGSTFATFSAQTLNPGSTFGSGTLTLSDQVNSGTVCNSYGAASSDNNNAACSSILSLTNLAPGVVGGQAKLTISNTGSLDASLFSVFAPYVNTKLNQTVASGATIGTGQSQSSLTVTPLEGTVTAGDKIALSFGNTTQQLCASANASAAATSISVAGGPAATGTSCGTTLNGAITNAQTTITVASASGFPTSGNYSIQVDNELMTVTGGQGTTTWTVTRGAGGTSAAAHSSGAAVVSATPVTASTSYAVGSRLYDSSSDTSAANTDCYDAKTTSSPVSGATYGTQLNFNPIANNPFCSTALLYIQEQSTVGASTYDYCWFGRGSAFGDQSPSGEDSNGQCRTPTTLTLSGTYSSGQATYGLTVAALAGNIRSGDTITLAENGTTTTCTAAANYFMTATSVSLNGCSTSGAATTFDSSAAVKDTSAFTALNGSNPSSTISYFDTNHASPGAISMAPLTGNGSTNSSSSVQLAKHGGTGSVGDTRVFYVGVYVPSSGSQNGLQGLVSTFGLTWHIDQ